MYSPEHIGHHLLMFTPADLAAQEAEERRILPSRTGIVIIWALFAALVLVLWSVSSETGSFVLLYVFGIPFLLGALVCSLYVSPWGRRRFRVRAGRRLAGALFSDATSAGSLPAWTVCSSAFPQSLQHLSEAGLSDLEVECALVLAAELEPDDLVDVSGLAARVRALS